MLRYPFSPQVLDALPEELAELYRSLEIKLLEEICSRLKIAGQLNEVTVQDIRALRAMGIDLSDIRKAIAETSGVGEEKLSALLDDVVSRNQAYYSGLMDLAGITAPEVLVSERDIAAIRRQTWGAYKNITGSMGFLAVQGGRLTMLEPAEAYHWALDSAVLQIQSGAISYNQAIADAVKQLADSGLKTVSYESGHVDSVDVAVRRAVMTGVNQLNQKYREQSMDYLETDLVEVTAHLGARNIPGPMGWEAHSEWQGKVYRWRKYPKTSKGDYPDFEDTCGMGSVTGIGGANCRHSFYSFTEGVSERTYTDEQLEAMKPENRPKTVFEGREYDDYQATQMQRRIERTIRKQKRLKASYEAAGLEDKAQSANIRLQRLNEKYRQFSKAASLPEQRERMKVSYVDDASIKTAERLKATTSFKNAMESLGYSLKGFDHYSGDIEALNRVQSAFTRLSTDFPKEAEGLTVGIGKAEDGTIGWFDNKSKTIYFNKSVFSDWPAFQKEYETLVQSGHFPAGTTADGCFYHEFGHLVGELRGINAQRLTRETLVNMGLGYGSPPHISAKAATESLRTVLSKYSAKFSNRPFEEVIAECFSEWYTSGSPREFCKEFLRKVGVI